MNRASVPTPPGRGRAILARDRLIVLAVASVAFVVLVVVLYDRGVLPLAGPFVAMVAVAWIVLGPLWWSHRRVRRAGERLRGEVEGLANCPEMADLDQVERREVEYEIEQVVRQLAWSNERLAAEHGAALAVLLRSLRSDSTRWERWAGRVEKAGGDAAAAHQQLERVGRRFQARRG